VSPNAATSRRWRDIGGRGPCISTLQEGLSLVELSVAMAVFALVMTAAVLFMTTYLQVSQDVTATYAASDSVLPVVNTLDRYFRALVVPPASAQWRPVLASGALASDPVVALASQVDFYSNLRNSGGPDLVEAQLDAAATPPGGAAGTLTLTVTAPDSGSCVLATWCTYRAAPDTIARVSDVEAPANSVFAYLPIDEPMASSNVTSTTGGPQSCPATVPAAPASWPPSVGQWPPPSTSSVWTTDPADAWCGWIARPLDNIWALAVTLTVESSTPQAVPASRQWVTYLISPSTAEPVS